MSNHVFQCFHSNFFISDVNSVLSWSKSHWCLQRFFCVINCWIICSGHFENKNIQPCWTVNCLPDWQWSKQKPYVLCSVLFGDEVVFICSIEPSRCWKKVRLFEPDIFEWFFFLFRLYPVETLKCANLGIDIRATGRGYLLTIPNWRLYCMLKNDCKFNIKTNFQLFTM